LPRIAQRFFRRESGRDLLEQHGYRCTGAFRTIDTPGDASLSNGPGVYVAQPIGFPGISISRADGGPFALYEFSAAGLLAGAPSA
jgi:hypothetical protein